MKYRRNVITLLALGIVLSCGPNPVNFEGGNPEGMAKMYMKATAPAMATDLYESQNESAAEQPDLSTAASYDRKIIRDASLDYCRRCCVRYSKISDPKEGEEEVVAACFDSACLAGRQA